MKNRSHLYTLVIFSILLFLPLKISVAFDNASACIEELHEKGISYEDARKRCATLLEVTTALATEISECEKEAKDKFEECIKSGREVEFCRRIYAAYIAECKSKEKEEKPEKELSCEERVRKIITETCIKRGIDEKICKERYNTLVEYECISENSCEQEARETYEYCIDSGREEEFCKKKYSELLEKCNEIEKEAQTSGCEEKAEIEENACKDKGIEEKFCKARYRYVLSECEKCLKTSENKENCFSIESSKLPCEERVKKVIEETCTNQGIDQEICEQRYENLVKYECETYPEEVCSALRKELTNLVKKLEGASDYEKEEIKKRISDIKSRYNKCIRVVDECEKLKEKLQALQGLATQGLIFSSEEEANEFSEELSQLQEKISECEKKKYESSKVPEINRTEKACNDLKLVKEAYDNLLKKKEKLKNLVKSGNASEDDLEEIGKEGKLLKARIKILEKACNGENEIKVTPCVKLATLEKIYEEIKEKLEIEKNEVLQARLENVKNEIERLKLECKNTPLQNEEITTEEELENAYEYKLSAVVEKSDINTLENELKKIEEEKKKLIEEFTKKMKELDLRKLKIIREIRIRKGSLNIDGAETQGKFTLDLKGNSITLMADGEKTILQEKNISVETDAELEYVNNTLVSSKTKKVISFLPSQVREKIKGDIKRIRLVEEKEPKYIVTIREKRKILGIIPTEIEVEKEISAESGESLGERRPWWSFLLV